MAFKIRVTATNGPLGQAAIPPLIYRAEAYDEADGFREPIWSCKHDHASVVQALDCGCAWLDRRAQLESA